MPVDSKIDLNASKTTGIKMSICKTQMSTLFLTLLRSRAEWKNPVHNHQNQLNNVFINSFKYINHTQLQCPRSIIC